MADLNLGGDESVLKKLPRIIVGGIRYEAVLTTRRIILAERETGTIREDIPYQDIVLAVAGQNSIREPQLRLTIASPAGEQRSIDLIFVYQPAGMNVQNIESCMEILKDHQVAVQKTGSRDATGPMSRVQALTPGMAAGNRAQSRPAVPDMGLMSTFGSGGVPVPEDSQKTPWLIPIIVVAAILVVIFLGVSLAGQGPVEEMPVSATATPSPTATSTPVITPPVTTIIPVLPANTPSVPWTAVPTNGIWLYVSSPGNYIGWIKADGWTSEINATGTSLTQIATQNTLIEGSVEKTDGTGNPLEVKLYNGGEPVFEQSLTKPYGMIQVRQTVGPAIIKNPSPTPIPTPTIDTIPTPDPAIVLKLVPSQGVFVRASYPGEFTGTISGNGVEQRIIGSGDQFYQVSLLYGQIDGFFEKQDGSGRSLVVQVYKDGSLITAYKTIKPYGTVEFHTTV